jgi:hypothetical protein
MGVILEGLGMHRIALAGFLLFAPAALAEDGAALRHAQTGNHAPDCYCRAQGKIFAPGERICIRTAQGGRLAECQMVTNVMSWGITDRPCPES